MGFHEIKTKQNKQKTTLNKSLLTAEGAAQRGDSLYSGASACCITDGGLIFRSRGGPKRLYLGLETQLSG